MDYHHHFLWSHPHQQWLWLLFLFDYLYDRNTIWPITILLQLQKNMSENQCYVKANLWCVKPHYHPKPSQENALNGYLFHSIVCPEVTKQFISILLHTTSRIQSPTHIIIIQKRKSYPTNSVSLKKHNVEWAHSCWPNNSNWTFSGSRNIYES